MKKWLYTILICLIAPTVLAKGDHFNFLSQLTNAHGPSGFEDNVRKLLSETWKPYTTSLQTDGMGNLIGEVQGTNHARVLLMAHMDEVGLIVSKIEANGLVKVQMLGGFDDNVLTAQRFKIQTPNGIIDAYSGVDSIHHIPKDKRGKLIKKENLFLDIGAMDRAEALRMGVRPGLPVSPDSKFTQLTEHRYMAKALDDRIGLSVLTDVLKAVKHPKNTIFFAATVQEEVGLRGAQVIYNDVKPDVAINIEVGIASDFPLYLGKAVSDVRLGEGPTLFVFDSSLIPHQPLLRWVADVAKKEGIPVQYEVEPGYGEDAAKIQGKGLGIPAINIGIPIRYAHQQAGIFDARDYEQAVKLVKAIVLNFQKQAITR